MEQVAFGKKGKPLLYSEGQYAKLASLAHGEPLPEGLPAQLPRAFARYGRLRGKDVYLAHRCVLAGAAKVYAIELREDSFHKAVERVQTLTRTNVTLKVMDATSMDLADDEFDKAIATYTISAVPDPVAVLREMRRVVKSGGVIVILNHFRSEGRIAGRLEDLVAPFCTRLGWKSNLALGPLLARFGLEPEVVVRLNMFNGWRLVKCVNRK